MHIDEFKLLLPARKAILGIDYGTHRMGLAVSDLNQNIASAYKIIYRRQWRQDVADLKQIIEEKEIGAIIYGLPLQMDGREGSMASEVRAFAEKFYTEVPLPFMFWDERLSSAAVEKFLIKDFDLSRSKRRKVLDSSAASYILQGALDALKYNR